jgi:hypothetical protein
VVVDRFVLEGTGLYRIGFVNNLQSAGVYLDFVFKFLIVFLWSEQNSEMYYFVIGIPQSPLPLFLVCMRVMKPT